MVGFNESALNIVQAPYLQNLVTVEQCKDFVEASTRNTYIAYAVAILALIVMIWLLFRRGQIQKPKMDDLLDTEKDNDEVENDG